MDIQTFQNKLSEVRKLAAGNGNTLTKEQVKAFFAELKPDREQLIQILRYLKTQGISISGLEEPDAQPEEESAASKALTEEEQEYLREYRRQIGGPAFDVKEADRLFGELAKGAAGAKEKLVQMYLPVAADIACGMYCEGIHFHDLLQEANVSLLSAFQIKQPQKKDDAWLRKEIKNGLKLVIEEQTQQKLEDECLVGKVEKLERTVKELTDDEDEQAGSGFSVEELAILLDMSVEEIEDVLRLTGGM